MNAATNAGPDERRGPRVFLTGEWRWLAMLNYRVDVLARAPDSAFLAEGSRIAVHMPARLQLR